MQVELNLDKCCSMNVTLNQLHKIFIPIIHTIHNYQLLINASIKASYVIQSDLNSHVNQITAKVSQTLAMLERNIKLVLNKIKDKAYKSSVRPKTLVASSVWAHGIMTLSTVLLSIYLI